MTFYLASQSPRRADLLRQIGVEFQAISPGVGEDPQHGELPAQYAVRLAAAKAGAGLEQVAADDAIVLGADTVVVLNNQIFGKPHNAEEGIAMLRRLSGQCHQVISAITVCSRVEAKSAVVTTNVVFRDLPTPMLRRYWEFEEPRDKAGGYAIQGLGAVFVQRIEGSYSNVVGLPIETLLPLLEYFNVPYWFDKTEFPKHSIR